MTYNLSVIFGLTASELQPLDPSGKRRGSERVNIGSFIVDITRVSGAVQGIEIADSPLTEPAQDDVRFVQTRLRDIGFREAATVWYPGTPLSVDGVYGVKTQQAVRLFKALAFRNGNSGVLDGVDFQINDDLLTALRNVKKPLWVDVLSLTTADMATDWPPISSPDSFGMLQWKRLFEALRPHLSTRLLINDISLGSGGFNPGHQSHQTGIDMDLMAPNTQGDLQPTNYYDRFFDRGQVRGLLTALKATGQLSLCLFNDPDLIEEKLCIPYPYHDNHIHIRLSLRRPRSEFATKRFVNLLVAARLEPFEESLLEIAQALPGLSLRISAPHVYSSNPGVIDIRDNAIPILKGAGHCLLAVTDGGRFLTFKSAEVRSTAMGKTLIVAGKEIRHARSIGGA